MKKLSILSVYELANELSEYDFNNRITKLFWNIPETVDCFERLLHFHLTDIKQFQQEIKEAIQSTLVISNKQSIDIAVKKIIDLLK